MIDATPLLRLYARRRRARLAAEDAVAMQEAQLLRLLRRAAETPFGRAHGFERIRNVAEFQARVPLRSYEDFWRDWWQPRFPHLANVTWPGAIPFFAVTSGTSSGRTKYIPVSAAMLRANRRAALDILVHHVTHRPHSRALGGRIFMLGGSTALKEEAPGIRSGDLSGIAVARTPLWARPFAFPPREVALMEDWDAKIQACIAGAPTADIRIVTGTPSWLQILFDRHAAATGKPALARALYPALELLVHGGVNFQPYRARFEAFLAGSHAELREVYPASEGFVAIADEGPTDGLRLLADNGLFFEFVPIEDLSAAHPRRFWLADIECGVDYAILVTSCAGLWAYILGDTVRFLSCRPPRLVVTGRTSYMMSAFGEHLIEAEIEEAVAKAAAAIGADVSDFAMGALFPERPGEVGRHLFVVEFAAPVAPAPLAAFARTLDAGLAALNDDYRAHRAGDVGMAAPEIEAVPAGFFARWMKGRGRLGGQHKVPRVIVDQSLFADLRRAVEEAKGWSR
ncbi:MAG: GH3 family domain-containing protein [Pseudomonadota bacterium]